MHADQVTSGHARNEYPLDVFASRLRWLLRNDDVPITFDDWKAGPLAIADVGTHRVVLGGDAAEEGWIGVSVIDSNGEFVEIEGLTDGCGQIESDSWDGLRFKIGRIPGVLPDPFRKALVDFHNATTALRAAWEELPYPADVDAATGYPESLPSFDEFDAQVYEWRVTHCPID